jgi:hypothetical protein
MRVSTEILLILGENLLVVNLKIVGVDEVNEFDHTSRADEGCVIEAQQIDNGRTEIYDL